MLYTRWEEVQSHPVEQWEPVVRFVEHLANIPEAFQSTDGIVRCIDEGTPGDVHLAGSGVLFDDEAALIALLHRNNIRGLTSHSGCGAAALYVSRRNLGPVNPDRAGAHRIQELAQRAGIEYAGHIDKLNRPVHRHTAFAAYYDGTGQFNPRNVPELPLGFVISRSLHESPQMPIDEMSVAAKIAFGDHGWGRRFSGKTPFLIVPVAAPGFPLDQLVEELQPLKAKYRDLVRIDGFDASPYRARVQA